MKYSLAIAALLGLATIDQVNAVRMGRANPATVENIKKVDFPGSHQGMGYARTEEPVVIPPKEAPCPKGKICNQYDKKKIHYEEPFNGISEHQFKIGHQNVETVPYKQTSIYPTAGKKTGFSQNKQVAHIHFAQAENPAVVENIKGMDYPGSHQGMKSYARSEAASEPEVILGPCPKGVNCNKYDKKYIRYEEKHNGISDAKEHRLGHQDVNTVPYVTTSIYPTAGAKTGFAQSENPAVVENVKKLDFPGSKQGMAYARTEKIPERPFPLGQCADGVNCNKYYTRTIHYEEPFNGISAATHRIGS